MPKIRNQTISVAARSAKDDIIITVGGDFLVEKAELLNNPDGKFTLQVQIWDDDTFGNSDQVPSGRTDTFDFEDAEEGVNPFSVPTSRTADEAKRSETGAESWAELYARMKATFPKGGGGRWVNTGNVAVKFR